MTCIHSGFHWQSLKIAPSSLFSGRYGSAAKKQAFYVPEVAHPPDAHGRYIRGSKRGVVDWPSAPQLENGMIADPTYQTSSIQLDMWVLKLLKLECKTLSVLYFISYQRFLANGSFSPRANPSRDGLRASNSRSRG
jgi:hypothetical protein